MMKRRHTEVTGPMRTPQTYRRSARLASVGQSSATEDEDLTPRRAKRRRDSGSRKPVHASHNMTRSLSAKRRSTSTMMTPPRTGARRRTRVRKSLAGPHVEGTTVERRAEMVADISRDCLFRMLESGLSSRPSRRKETAWRKAWAALQGQSTFS